MKSNHNDMNLVDFNIHLPPHQASNVISRIEGESALDVTGLVESVNAYAPQLKHLRGANFMFFNQGMFCHEVDLRPFMATVKSLCADVGITALLPFRDPGISDVLDNMSDSGVGGVKFHSYVQKIDELDFDKAVTSARLAEDRGLWICIDASFGTTGMYQYDNMKLAAVIAEAVQKVPVIILHSGGLRALEAMLLALDRPNIYLETSFSLPFYEGSRVADDLAFAYRRIGSERLLYASDHPYVSIDENERLQTKFFTRLGFSDVELENIFSGNALRLFGA